MRTVTQMLLNVLMSGNGSREIAYESVAEHIDNNVPFLTPQRPLSRKEADRKWTDASDFDACLELYGEVDIDFF